MILVLAVPERSINFAAVKMHKIIISKTLYELRTMSFVFIK